MGLTLPTDARQIRQRSRDHPEQLFKVHNLPRRDLTTNGPNQFTGFRGYQFEIARRYQRLLLRIAGRPVRSVRRLEVLASLPVFGAGRQQNTRNQQV